MQAAHRPKPRLESTVVGFDGIVRVLLEDVQGRWQLLVKHARVGVRTVGGHFHRTNADRKRPGEECSGRIQIAGDRQHDVDDRPVLVDSAVKVGPAPCDPHVKRCTHR